MKAAYGRRIQVNGNVVWCELTSEEVEEALVANVRRNAAVYRQCVVQARELLGAGEPSHLNCAAANLSVQQEVHRVARALLDQCGLKEFVAVEKQLDSKAHWYKINDTP